MTTWSSTGLSNAISGETDVAIRPKIRKADAVGVLYCHGAGGPATQALDPTFAPVLHSLAQLGHPVLSCDLGGTATWGNDTVLTRMTTAKAYLHSSLGARTGKILLVGASMGGLSAFVWAKSNPTLVAGIVGIVPVSNVTDIVTNNRQGLAASVNSAYSGGWSEATYGASRNPTTFAAAGSLAGLPMLLLPADGDTTVLPSTVASVASSVGATAKTVTMTGTHSAFTVPLDEVRAFARANAA